MFVYLAKSVDNTAIDRPKFDFDLNEPASSAESEPEDSRSSEKHKNGEVEQGLGHDKLPLQWNREYAKQRSNRKPISDIGRLTNVHSEQIKVRPKRKRDYSHLPEEQKERYRKQKREAYAAKSKKERAAIGKKNFKNFQDRLARMTPEQRKAHDVKQLQWEQNYLARRRTLWRIRWHKKKANVKKGKAVSDSSKASKMQFAWDLNKSPPPEEDSDQGEPSQLGNLAHSPAPSLRPASLGITRRRRSDFARKKRKNFGNIPNIEKGEECIHSPYCEHWKTLTKPQKHVISNRIYRENNPYVKEKAKKQKKEKYKRYTKAERQAMSQISKARRKNRLAAMDDQERLEYNERRNKWQREFYMKKKLSISYALYIMEDEHYHQFVVFMRLFVVTTSVIVLLLIVPCFASAIKADIDLSEEQRNVIATMPDR
ncbi:uncharacterized protein FA14DRAFT_180197 [Meira miltonrushii]|uniref:Uncharacterized protein n=1 Tax=Meira miltonrushii TaxID=1280837 RepID=A0A316VC47_9BASI|nr:uncharacterized protein FA14DRAFT_180197 [Meira miltonrushii]PWN33551.1 hypothetical protein FA14DRAFT_180197 [Meira miltonrushii]